MVTMGEAGGLIDQRCRRFCAFLYEPVFWFASHKASPSPNRCMYEISHPHDDDLLDRTIFDE